MHDSASAILILSSIRVFTRNLVWAAGEAQRPCWVVTPDQKSSWRSYPHVLGVETIDQDALLRADPALQRWVLDFCERHEIGMIVAGDTRGSRFLLRMAPTLRSHVQCFPICESDLFERMYDKWRFAKLLRELGLPSPPTTLLQNVEDAESGDIEFPVIVKPVQGEGGFGIETANDSDELRRIVEARTNLRDDPLVAQAYVPGSDIDLSLLADRGRCLAWSIQVDAGDGVMRFLDRPDVLQLGQELVRRTGYHGVMHLDMRIDRRDDSVVFIESNPRFWGSLCYSVWMGVNFLDLGARLAESEEPASNFSPVQGDCPYLGVTAKSLPRALLGARPRPKRLSEAQLRSWLFHHRFGGGSLSDWLTQRARLQFG